MTHSWNVYWLLDCIIHYNSRFQKKKKKNWLSNFMYGLLKINFWLRHYMLHCKYTQHRSLLVLVSPSLGKKKCLNQSLCHKITESMTTYSFISYKLSPQFRYHCISQCHLEEMQRMVILASILDLLDLHEVFMAWFHG